MQDHRTQVFIKNAAILTATSIFVKIIGALYKIPLFDILDEAGTGVFQVTYSVYTLILNIATAGVPVALSRMVSAAAAVGNTNLVKRYFSVAMRTFFLIGIAAMLVMFFFSNQLAGAMNNSLASPGIKVLAPAVFFVCIVSVYRGYAQGFEYMIPTAASQSLEVMCKAVIGIVIAFLIRGSYAVQYVSAGSILGVTIGQGLCVPLLVWYKRRVDKDITLDGDEYALPGPWSIFAQLIKVSIPITIGASFMSIITVVDNSVVLGQLQRALGMSEIESSAQFGILTYGLTLYNLPSALIVPVAISLVPAIAASLAKGHGAEARSVMQTSVKLVNLFAMPACAGLMVLPGPIMSVLFRESGQLAARILIFLAAAAFFVCLQLVTTAILQANGNERLPLLSIPVGGAAKILLSYTLVGNPNVGVLGSAVSSLACFVVICVINIVFIKIKVAQPPKFGVVFIKPIICTTGMAAVAALTYKCVSSLGLSVLGTGRFALIIYLAVSILIAIIAYIGLVIVTRTITAEDMLLIPKGEKLAKKLRIR